MHIWTLAKTLAPLLPKNSFISWHWNLGENNDGHTKQNWPNLCKWESLCPMVIKTFLIFCCRMWEWWATQSFSILSLREMFVRFWASSLRDNSALDWDQDSKCIAMYTVTYVHMTWHEIFEFYPVLGIH